MKSNDRPQPVRHRRASRGGAERAGYRKPGPAPQIQSRAITPTQIPASSSSHHARQRTPIKQSSRGGPGLAFETWDFSFTRPQISNTRPGPPLLFWNTDCIVAPSFASLETMAQGGSEWNPQLTCFTHFLPNNHLVAFSISVFCTGLVKILSPCPMFIYTILYCVFVHTTGISPYVNRPLIPSG